MGFVPAPLLIAIGRQVPPWFIVSILNHRRHGVTEKHRVLVEPKSLCSPVSLCLSGSKKWSEFYSTISANAKKHTNPTQNKSKTAKRGDGSYPFQRLFFGAFYIGKKIKRPAKKQHPAQKQIARPNHPFIWKFTEQNTDQGQPKNMIKLVADSRFKNIDSGFAYHFL